MTHSVTEYPVIFAIKSDSNEHDNHLNVYLQQPTFKELSNAAIEAKYQLLNEEMATCNISKLIDEDGYEYESDYGLSYHFDPQNYNNDEEIEPLHIQIVLDINDTKHQSVDEKVDNFMMNDDDDIEYKINPININNNHNIFDEEEIFYDTQHENSLIDEMIVQSIYFHTVSSQNNEWYEQHEANKQITTYSRIDDESYCHLRAEMIFTKYLNTHPISDYYAYLECGHDEQFYVWDENTKTNIVWSIDTSHQIMYTKGNAGTYFKTFIGQRDICYMHSRFKRTVHFEQDKYDIVGSLDYSINENNPRYVKQYDTECTRAIIKYRGYVLIKKNNNENDVKLVYISCFNADPNGNIPQLVTWSYIKNKALEMMNKFIDDWPKKMNILQKKQDLYHEKQKLEMSLLHAMNALLQKTYFTETMLDNICKELCPNKYINPHKSVFQTGNYDINVLMKGLSKLNIEIQWFDKRKMDELDLRNDTFLEPDKTFKFIGFIMNNPLKRMFNIFNNRQWLTIKKIDNEWYNLDSKLEQPLKYKNVDQVTKFIKNALQCNNAELMICRQSAEVEGIKN